MSDLNWCTYCDTAISHFSESLYCSEQCLRADALRNHPLLGYNWDEFVDFPRPYPRTHHRSRSPSILSVTASSFSSVHNEPISPAASSSPSSSPSPALTASSSPSNSVSSSLKSTTHFSSLPPKLNLSPVNHKPSQLSALLVATSPSQRP